MEGDPLSMPGQVVVLRTGDGTPLDRVLARWLEDGTGAGEREHELGAATEARGEVLVLVGDRYRGEDGNGALPLVPERLLVDLLTGPFGIGAVVPLVVDANRRVVEAGSYTGPSGQSSPFGAGTDLGAPEHGFRRDVAATVSPVLAVSAAALEGFVPLEGGDDATLRDALDHIKARGRRVVFEPGWQLFAEVLPPPAPTPVGPRRWAGRDEPCPTRVLVVTSTIPGSSAGADGTVQLVEALARCKGARVALACADGFGAARYAPYYQRQGVEVVAGPQDWLGWCGDRRYHYSHVVVTDGGLATRLWPIARSTQPQAMAVLYSEQLPLRRHHALGDASWHAEGANTVAELLHSRLLRQLEGVEAAWCASPADASLLAGLAPQVKVTTWGPPLQPPAPGKGFDDREGVAVVAVDPWDISADPESAAVRALEELVPPWRRRDMSLPVTVVSDWPTPGLSYLAGQMGASVVPSGGDLVGVLARCRLVVGPVEHGASPLSWATYALAAGTPLLTTAKAVEASWLEDLLPGAGAGVGAVVPDVATMAQRGWSLLTDERAWRTFAVELSELAEELAARRASAVTSAFVAAGLDVPGPALWPVEGFPAHPAVPPVRVAPRPPSVADPPAVFVPDSLSEDERYELWHQRRGPNPEVVSAIGAEALAAQYQPTISVLMPVCDTEPWMLEAAVGSVFAQAYPNWQLCLADDASERKETLAALEALVARDTRVNLTRLEKRSGIAAATNAALGLATGDFVGFLDHDDILKPHALAQVVRWLDADPALDLLYSDEDKLTPAGRLTEARWKPDWSPNLLLCQNYVCHFLVVRRALIESLGGLRPEYDGSQDYDLVLRVTDVSDHIAHIPDSLYSWRMHEKSAASLGENKPFAWLAAQRALGDWLRRREDGGGTGGWTEEGAWFDVHRVRFRRLGEPKVSVIIPTRNGRHLLGRCIESVISKSVYDNFELVVVDNQSDDPETLEYLSVLPGKVLRYPHEFNYPRQVNLAAASVECDLLVFLNNDTEILTTDWLDRLVEQAMRPEVGAVGPRLLFPNGDVQHEGIIIGAWRGHANSIEWGNWWRMGDLLRDVSAVTGACMATRPGVFWRVGGYDERLRVAYNDVDYCLRLHQAGYQVVYEPDAAVFHAEGSTRGRVEDPEDAPLFDRRWRPRSSCDPYYNPNLNRNRLLFRVEP